MDKILVWGIGSYYDNNIANWVNKNEVETLAFISDDIMLCKTLDGKPIIKSEEIKFYDYDYIIVASAFFYKEIKKKAILELSIPIDRIINGKIIKHPCFNWDRYKKILKSEVTLITEACYGGYIYNQLGLKFTSPFINTRIQEYDYLKLLNSWKYYINQAITPIYNNVEVLIDCSRISWGKTGYPIFALDDVILHAIHAVSSEVYKEEWIRRSKRINENNMLVMMIIENDDVAEKFSKLNFKNKIGFYFKETCCNDIVCLKEWTNYNVRLRNGHDFLSYVHHLFWDDKILRYIDIFKMLSGEKDFIRMY